MKVINNLLSCNSTTRNTPRPMWIPRRSILSQTPINLLISRIQTLSTSQMSSRVWQSMKTFFCRAELMDAEIGKRTPNDVDASATPVLRRIRVETKSSTYLSKVLQKEFRRVAISQLRRSSGTLTPKWIRMHQNHPKLVQVQQRDKFSLQGRIVWVL